MVSSAPSLSFNPAVTSYGTINVGSSSARISYHVRNKAGSYATARNTSISFLGSNNSSEPKDESWVQVSTTQESGYIRSLPDSLEVQVADISQAYSNSRLITTWVSVPAAAVTSGQVDFKHYFRYQYTG